MTYETNQPKKYKGTILMDMDDVLADFMPAWLSVYNEKYQDTLSPEKILDWNTSKYVKPECGEKIFDLFKVPGLFRNLKPAAFSQEVIRRLINNHFEVVIVSDSPAGHSYDDCKRKNGLYSNPADDKRRWLKEHFPMINSGNVVFTSQKWRVMGDILVDDKAQTFEIFQERGRECLLVDMPHNRHIETDLRVSNLLEAEKLIYKKFGII